MKRLSLVKKDVSKIIVEIETSKKNLFRHFDFIERIYIFRFSEIHDIILNEIESFIYKKREVPQITSVLFLSNEEIQNQLRYKLFLKEDDKNFVLKNLEVVKSLKSSSLMLQKVYLVVKKVKKRSKNEKLKAKKKQKLFT